MLKLVRRGDKVYFEGEALTIVPQATKGPGKEVVKIDGLPGSNGQKWISLSKLSEGENIFQDNDLARRNYSSQGYQLTEEEQAEVDELTSRIQAIIEEAKKRYVPPIKKKPEAMNETELLAYIAQLEQLARSKAQQ